MKEEKRVGKMAYKHGKYFLEMEGRDEELSVDPLIDESKFKELVGEEVEVLYSEPRRFVVGVIARKEIIRCYLILCYYPVDIWGRPFGPVLPELEKDMRVKLADKFHKEGVISKEVYAKLIG